jgi:hypothetical protein
MINYFILFFGIIQLLIASVEIIMPHKSFHCLESVDLLQVFHPFMEQQLIVVGFPLTIYNGYLSSVIFIIGLVVVFTGPVILIYPEKIREAFSFSSDTFQEGSLKKIVRFDALMRMAAGIILVLSFYKS